MSTGRGNQLTKQVGEFLVAAELARRGWISAVLSGNTPDFDLVAADNQCRSITVQVKAITGGGWHFDVARFAKVSFEGSRQIIGRIKPCPKSLMCVLVVVGSDSSGDQFYILPMRTLYRRIVSNQRAWLKTRGGVRPRNPMSTHAAIWPKHVQKHLNDWEALNRTVG